MEGSIKLTVLASLTHPPADKMEVKTSAKLAAGSARHSASFFSSARLPWIGAISVYFWLCRSFWEGGVLGEGKMVDVIDWAKLSDGCLLSSQTTRAENSGKSATIDGQVVTPSCQDLETTEYGKAIFLSGGAGGHSKIPSPQNDLVCVVLGCGLTLSSLLFGFVGALLRNSSEFLPPPRSMRDLSAIVDSPKEIMKIMVFCGKRVRLTAPRGN
ncbi:hypothetical protein RRG08_060944 [Elysia crispata]|uniref:Uncharacterized protein n=1 Tax=Elysia crispata TaxID=231223 RepID=A0AAE1AUP8_9GAST|nr:hypothetical protein RRG08_060944 [Elysia crispata]